ncbi:hypothetical protein I8752_35960 [Nostocaceae cyanobacterium CENA369]|uniref:Uncharacterized protein n=1 Tax=Dendronalium phyllosphericum CENA369 TaxID=1725256 RepID=A0A8J7LKQ8_9NOST|nr:hypothetical protein [Dendronalium phyllosphericum]MBH8578248.1 hypothetical protein [Dendronalium phyllosphericum CENA369]
MEPLTAGAIAFTSWVVGKLIDWSTDKTFDIASQRLMQLLVEKSPDTAKSLTAAAERAALAPNEREDIGEAVLVEEVSKAAAKDAEIKAAVEALGNDVNQAVNENREVEKRLTTVIENWKGISIKGGITTINNPTLNF